MDKLKVMSALQQVLEDSNFKELDSDTIDTVVNVLIGHMGEDYVRELLISEHSMCPKCYLEIGTYTPDVSMTDVEPPIEYDFCDECGYKAKR